MGPAAFPLPIWNLYYYCIPKGPASAAVIASPSIVSHLAPFEPVLQHSKCMGFLSLLGDACMAGFVDKKKKKYTHSVLFAPIIRHDIPTSALEIKSKGPSALTHSLTLPLPCETQQKSLMEFVLSTPG